MMGKVDEVLKAYVMLGDDEDAARRVDVLLADFL